MSALEILEKSNAWGKSNVLTCVYDPMDNGGEVKENESHNDEDMLVVSSSWAAYADLG